MSRVSAWITCWHPVMTISKATRFTLAGRVALISALLAGTAGAQQGDPAWPGHHPLTQTQAGSLLVSELRCAVCHSGIERSSWPEKAAPELAEVGARVSPEFLKKFWLRPRWLILERRCRTCWARGRRWNALRSRKR